MPGGGHLLDVPYFSQLDNQCNPMGSCNVTCVAMALAYLGMTYSSGSQLEDSLYREMETLGWYRHDPNHLKALVERFPGSRTSSAPMAASRTSAPPWTWDGR